MRARVNAFFLKQPLVRGRDGLARLLRAAPGDSRRLGPPRRSVFDTVAWGATEAAAGSGARLHPVTPARDVTRTAPAHMDPPMAARFTTMRNGKLKPRFVAELPGGRWWGRGFGYAIDADDALHHDLSPAFTDFEPMREGAPVTHDALRQPWLPRPEPKAGTVAALGTLFCDNFHHWLLDTLPKFRLLEESGWPIARFDQLLLPLDSDRPWHRESLARLGVPPGKILRGGAARHVCAERLVVPSYTEPGCEPERFDYSPEGLAFVRGLFLRDAPTTTERPKKILVSRELATCRRWSAGEIGHARLAREGFRKICLEQHSLTEQAALFHGAGCIVLPTGGGLANLAFCQPGTRVVELFSESYVPTFSVVLASALGLRYHALVGPPSAVPPHDIAVPIERVLAALA